MTTAKYPPGRFETLNEEEEYKLKEVWTHFLQFWGTSVLLPDGPSRANTLSTINTRASHKTSKSKKSKHKRGHKRQSSGGYDLKTTRTRESIESEYTHESIHESFKDFKPEDIYQAFWNMLRVDTPDNLLLRFLRARKWDSDKSLAMLAHTLYWRSKERDCDQLLLDGDRKPFEENDKGFLKQLTLCKAYFKGYDNEGRPIVHIRPRLHHSSHQNMKDIENYVLLTIEEARLFLREPVDSASVLFDLSGFTMSNMDYAPVKFMVAAFEAHYPESLGKLFVHKAPWIFPPIWNIIKNWLDPVVASKITFTKSAKDLNKYIPAKYIPESLGGEDDFEPKFIDPNPEDDALLSDTETRDAIKAERIDLITRFVDATVNWIESVTPEENKQYREEKRVLGRQLAENYAKLDPYVRSRNNFDRLGLLDVKA